MSFINEGLLKHLFKTMDAETEEDKYCLVSHTWDRRKRLIHRDRVKKWLPGAPKMGEIRQVDRSGPPLSSDEF